MAKKQVEVPDQGDLGAASSIAVTSATAHALTKYEPHPEIVGRVKDMLESLESFENVQLPMIRFKEGFAMSEGEDDIDTFEGVIIYTKEMNAYYKDRFKPGEKKRPDCLAPDGKTPVSLDPKVPPQAKSCSVCKLNQFGSAKEGDGKACKNVRPVYVLVRNPETGEFGVIPKMLRVPPTSLVLVKSYIMNLAADHGAYHAVLTRFSVFKRSENQTHYNIKFGYAGKLDPQAKADVAFIRSGWIDRLRVSDSGLDDVHQEEAQTAAPASGTVETETRF